MSPLVSSTAMPSEPRRPICPASSPIGPNWNDPPPAQAEPAPTASTQPSAHTHTIKHNPSRRRAPITPIPSSSNRQDDHPRSPGSTPHSGGRQEPPRAPSPWRRKNKKPRTRLQRAYDQ